jgi:hypothetical protein
MKPLARPLLVAVATATAALMPLPAEAATEHPVLITPAGEFQPARGPDHLAWEQNTKASPNHYDVFAQADGGGPIRVNAGRSNAAMGGIDDHTLVYQGYRKRKSDLFFYDLNTGQRSKLPKKVNSKQWEYWPSISEPWLLFGRWKMSKDARLLILLNLETGKRRVLNKIRGRDAFIGPHGDGRRRRDRERRLGQQRRDLRRRPRALLGPAGALADVGVGDGHLGRDVGQGLAEQRRLLRAGHDQGPPFSGRPLQVAELGAAELVVDLGGPARAAGPGEGAAVQRHRALAVADEDSPALESHEPPS